MAENVPVFTDNVQKVLKECYRDLLKINSDGKLGDEGMEQLFLMLQKKHNRSFPSKRIFFRGYAWFYINALDFVDRRPGGENYEDICSHLPESWKRAHIVVMAILRSEHW